jgi:TldD protein
MNASFKIAEKLLLEPTGLTEKHLHQALAKALGPGIEMADIYLQYSQNESWALEEGLVKKGGFSIDQGVGIRAISDDKTGFAYADDLTMSAMQEAAFYARRIANAGQTGRMKVWRHIEPQQQENPQINPINK